MTLPGGTDFFPMANRRDEGKAPSTSVRAVRDGALPFRPGLGDQLRSGDSFSASP